MIEFFSILANLGRKDRFFLVSDPVFVEFASSQALVLTMKLPVMHLH